MHEDACVAGSGKGGDAVDDGASLAELIWR